MKAEYLRQVNYLASFFFLFNMLVHHQIILHNCFLIKLQPAIPLVRVQVLHIELLEVLLNLHCESMCLVADAMVISTAASVDWFLVY